MDASSDYSRKRLKLLVPLLALSSACVWFQFSLFSSYSSLEAHQLPEHITTAQSRCAQKDRLPGPSWDFYTRSQSDRFEHGTKPTLISNARIWTGELNGTRVITGNILLDGGIIKAVGVIPRRLIREYGDDLQTIDANGAWVTPGIVDAHSHLGVDSVPELNGASDTNSFQGTIESWLRSLDGLNTHDDAYRLSLSGGVTTSLILPGSANAIGGQAFTIKLRKTKERSSSSFLLEPPYQINSSFPEYTGLPKWRQMKHACGENPSRVYSATRMDSIWAMRQAYNKAREIRDAQDAYCEKLESGSGPYEDLGPYPEELQWESLVDVLRGKVKVQVHCYEGVDIDNIVRLSNEFKFPIAAFHHASEAYLVPDLIKKAYGQTPGIALFAIQGRYKREAYRSSEFAPKILAEHGISVVMKSDHPVLNSRNLLFEAQQAHYYGFPENLALASVISTPATLIGLDYRIGFIKPGYDADVVIWDSHPLALGATPKQVWIDGIAQLENPHVIEKPDAFQHSPKMPNFDNQAAEAVKYNGLPPLESKTSATGTVVFTNVKSLFTRSSDGSDIMSQSFDSASEVGVVVVENGRVVCSGADECAPLVAMASVSRSTSFVDLKGGSIGPGLISYGSPLGLEQINQEPSTNDGIVLDPLKSSVPELLKADAAVIRASDGLDFSTRDAWLAYHSGVTSAITAPTHYGFAAGLGTFFSTGAQNRLEEGAVIQDVTGLHVSITHTRTGIPSISSQVAALRRLLLESTGNKTSGTDYWFHEVAEGRRTLVIEAHSADIMATLIELKREVEAAKGTTLKITFTNAIEAHQIAKHIAEANIGVILYPRSFPVSWQDRRILPGPPLSADTTIVKLIEAGVTVGVSLTGEIWAARNTRLDIAWAALESGGRISKEEALALGSTNLERLLGVEVAVQSHFDLVATEHGDLLDFESRVVAVLSPRRGAVDLLV